MPAIQHAGQPVVAPQIQSPQPGALGSVGNLRFKGEPGATPRASSPNVAQNTGSFFSKLAFYCSASPQARAQQLVRDRNETNTRALGNLLGHLTAPAGGKSELNAVASDLAHLADLIRGDIGRMPGGKEGVRAHLEGLSMLDLNALKTGVLSQPGARDAVLSMVSPGLRESAGTVLDQLMQSLDARVAGQALALPLADAAKALRAQPADGNGLGAALDQAAYGLHALGGASQDKVNAYVRDLPDAMLHTLTQALAPNGRLAAP
ncbi:MAG: hypothetical protein JHC61_16700, partial [Burkholderiaceae bacterium]|nr:hypothetical protein [Burkholderiaceae bacterium]